MNADVDLEFDLVELVEVFGVPLPLSNPDLLDYWFCYERADGGSVLVSLSGCDRSVAVIVRAVGMGAISIRVARCRAIRILEASLRTVEIVGDSPPLRCFLALDGDPILDLGVD